MKKLKYIYRVLLLLIIAMGSACSKDDDLTKEIVGLGGEKWPQGPLDEYIYTNFVEPYNIDVLYRWNPSEVSYSHNLVPPKEEKVIPVMEMIKKGWIEPYEAVAGKDFIKKLAPRQYLLVGSPEYNSSGTITLGTAEAGAKIAIFRVNWFDLKDRALVQAMLKTIHHEYAHILHQTVMYPLEFEAITPADYTSTWNQVNVTDARNAGFISSYAMSGPNEDFVEIASIMLTQGYQPFENIIKGISDPEGVAKIRKKQEIVLNYFRQTWDIDLYELQSKTEKAINEMSPPPTAFESVGFSKNSTVLFTTTLNDENKNWSEGFATSFQNASDKLGTLGNAGRFLEDLNVIFHSKDEMVLRLKYRNPSNPSSFYNADFSFRYVVDESTKTLKFEYRDVTTVLNSTAGGNAGVIKQYVEEILDYFDNKSFEMGWADDGFYPTEYAKLIRKDNEQNYLFGLLKNDY